MSDIMRITGMVTGLDTDQLVEDLISVEQIRVDRVDQQKQYTEWEQEAYREIINSIRDFKDQYFNYLTPDSNMRSANTFNSNEVTLDSDTLSSYISLSADSDAFLGDYTISNIVTATTAKITSSSEITAGIEGSSLSAPITIDSSNNQFYINFNDNTETITISSGDYNTLTDFKNEIQSQINGTFGSGKITVSLTGASSDQLLFSTDNTNTMTLSAVSDNDGLSVMGFSDVNLSNKADLDENLGDITDHFATTLSVAGTDDDISFTINDEIFTFSSAVTSLQDLMDEINDSDLGLTMCYDELNDHFILETDDTGVTSSLDVADSTGNLMEVLGLKTVSTVNGTDAVIDFDDGSGAQTITRSDNSFTINGINIELEKDYTGDIDFSINSDADSIVDKISAFVESYNELIDGINEELTEERDYDYKPLTEAQRDEMEEDEIDLWEERAKAGILRNDSILENMLNSMRTAIYEEVEGAGISLFELGISTSSDYSDRGKLIIDVDELTSAIESNPDKVIELFTSDSDTDEEKGISRRLYDIIEDNISTTRDENGYKGLLLEKAGIEGDVTQYSNSLTKKIEDYEERIDEILDKISEKEDYYYNMFAMMESYINQMNNQSAWLMSQMGMGDST
jgi:flagellar hook-associated protein 2